MINRLSSELAKQLAGEFKIVAVVGPRQSGKTTLARAVFANKRYVNLEEPDNLLFAREDPRRFFDQYPDGAVIDEAQRCPDLFSYLQGIVDERNAPGQFILTGSQHFGLIESITQSLAGRVGFLRLLPFSLKELQGADKAPDSAELMLFKGGYPLRNFRKRPVKTPKLYSYDPALAARLLGIESPEQLVTHPQRGALFENRVVAELLKGRGARGKGDNLFFWRNHIGHEIDVIADRGGRRSCMVGAVDNLARASMYSHGTRSGASPT